MILTRQQRLRRRIETAAGRLEPDLVLRNATYLDVFSCRWTKGDLAIIDGTIVATDPGRRAKAEIDLAGKHVVPGFIDAHVHVESSLMTPGYFQQAVLPRGTTSAICDPHELANVLGSGGIEYFLQASEALALDLWVMLSSCVPATHMETNGGGTIDAATLSRLAAHPRARGLAEMMNVPGVLHADPGILDKLAAFSAGPLDGHCPLLSGAALSAYAATGVCSCHEASRLEEAREKVTKGISIWIREGSVAKDLRALAPLLTLATSTSVGFCTDDRNPLDIADEGHIDHLVRGAIEAGVPAEVTYRAASWSVARHYGLASGWPSDFGRFGAVAPGFAADLVILDDVATCSVHRVMKSGVWSDAIETPKLRTTIAATNTIQAAIPERDALEGPSGRVHVIGVEHGRLLTTRHVLNHDDRGVAKLSVLERYGHGSKPANGYVRGFGEGLRGAIASSVGHDSHNLIVVGDRTDDMRVALTALKDVGGGFCVVRDGAVLARLALPLGGLMVDRPPGEIKAEILSLKEASRVIGCELPEPFLQLAFLSLPVIPSLKLTDKGLVDVDAFKLIDVRAS